MRLVRPLAITYANIPRKNMKMNSKNTDIQKILRLKKYNINYGIKLQVS